ncbi:hypothetical protein A3F59_03040 [Candidatus Roizmanbacteria bacterium RIFCSPHIGHO2_12_FULL_38_13]|nr:MAG: hypothetical protein A3F59_03040 [Candidatus Roizmanbacteria bacterium RIFCSPHIGHO2_12_FULL_38_13]
MKYQLNLLSEKHKSTLDKITYFSLHYLRYILVITQFVTICVFFYRFKVDQDIVDTRDLLLQKKAIVDATSTLLEKVKELDTKIKNIKSLYEKQTTMQQLYSYFFQSLPSDLTINSISFGVELTQFEGSAANIDSVKVFYEKLQQDKRFKSTTLTNITKTETGYDFSLELTEFIPTNGQQENT